MTVTLPAAWAGSYSGPAAVPGYDRTRLRPGIVHLGVGGFHRAHQATYLDRLNAQADSGSDAHIETLWGICGVGVLEADRHMRDVLADQDNLFTVLEKDPDGSVAAHVNGSMTEYLFLPDDPDTVSERLASPETRIVTLTITEGGYNLEPSTRAFDPTHPAILDEAHRIGPPRTHFRLLADALRTRRDLGIPAFTVASCDNIQGNGHVARSTLVDFIALTDPELAAWVAGNVAFPNSMVDRITPRTVDADRDVTARTLGLLDAWPVPCESFTQWVLEDDFPSGRPLLERVGVQFVDSVLPYEKMKLRLLNAGHQVIAHFAALLGHRYVHQAIADPLIRSAVRRFITTEAIPTLDPVPGIDLVSYQTQLIDRFSNRAVADTITRLCPETSTFIPTFLLPVVHDQLAAGRSISVGAAVIAAWACRAEEHGGRQIVDQRRDELVLQARDTTDPYAFIRIEEVFGDLVHHDVFRREYRRWRSMMRSEGVTRSLLALVGT